MEKVEKPAEAERRVAGSRLRRNLIRYLYERKSSATVYIVDAGTEQRKATSSQVSGILEILRGPLPTPGFEFLGKSRPLPATASARNLGSSSATYADTYEHKFSASHRLRSELVHAARVNHKRIVARACSLFLSLSLFDNLATERQPLVKLQLRTRNQPV